MRILPLLALLLPSVALAKKPVIYGAVVDRNGEEVARVNVKLAPGNVEIITDESGKFSIDYLRDEEGNRVKLSKKTDYEVEFFKLGYHPETIKFYFKRGELFLEATTLKEDTIAIKASQDNIDPSQYPERSESSGGSYEGE